MRGWSIDKSTDRTRANQGKQWSPQDDCDLRLEVSTGRTAEHAASFLCRSPEEVMKRAAELGLQWGGARR
jgi:hypothetical protein